MTKQITEGALLGLVIRFLDVLGEPKAGAGSGSSTDTALYNRFIVARERAAAVDGLEDELGPPRLDFIVKAVLSEHTDDDGDHFANVLVDDDS
jgi:hypothetical protein